MGFVMSVSTTPGSTAHRRGGGGGGGREREKERVRGEEGEEGKEEERRRRGRRGRRIHTGQGQYRASHGTVSTALTYAHAAKSRQETTPKCSKCTLISRKTERGRGCYLRCTSSWGIASLGAGSAIRHSVPDIA
eukprot:1777060-Rhodomonas_salina.3